MPNWIKTLLKVAGSSLALYLAIATVDWEIASQSFQNVQYSWVFLALLLYIASQALSAVRLNSLFGLHGIKMSQLENMKLYLVGMLYNFLIPGGIGGDGYKTVVIKRSIGGKTLNIAKLLVIDRSYGLLGLLTAGAILLSTTPFPITIKLAGWGAAIVALIIGFILVKKFVVKSAHRFAQLTGLSMLIQWLQIASIWALLFGVSSTQPMNFYGLVFLASSLASVFPLSIGGIGIRELAFVYGARYGMLNEGYAIFLSLGFLLMTIVVSIAGFPISLSHKKWKISAGPELEETA